MFAIIHILSSVNLTKAAFSKHLFHLVAVIQLNLLPAWVHYSFLFTASVITPQQLGQFLMEMKDGICITVLARHSVGPQFLHEKDLVGELWRDACNN